MSSDEPAPTEAVIVEPIARGRRLWRKSLLSLASVVVCLLVVELLLRASGFSYELRAGVLQGAAVDDPWALVDGCVIDRDYLWKSKLYDERLEHALATRPDVLFMGDSCTDWGEYDRHFVDLMRTSAPDRPIATAKLGVVGWSTTQGLQQLKKDGARVRPRVATFYFGWNDHWLNIGVTDAEVVRLNASPLFWFRSLRLGQLITKAIIGYQGRAHDSTAVRQHEDLRVPPAEFRDNLIRMVDKARELGITPILVTAPSAHEPGREPRKLWGRWVANLEDLIPLHQQYVDIVREVARDKDAALCDLAAAFDEFPREQVREAMFWDDGIHLSETGDRLVARLLVDAYLELESR